MLYFSSSNILRPANFLAALGLLLAPVGAVQAQTPASFGAVGTYSIGTNLLLNGLVVADVNFDSWPDLVTANFSGNTVVVLAGQAGGAFTAASTYPTGAMSQPSSVAVADMNGDGRPDLVTSNHENSTAGVLLGLASGGFAAASTYSAGGNSRPQDVAVGDLNGDGRLDIVTANASSKVGVLLGQAGGTFTSANTFSAGINNSPYGGIAVADVNSDGRLDIIIASNSNNVTVTLLGLAGGNFAAASTYSVGANSRPVSSVVADVNGDGRLDIVTANSLSNTAGVLLGLASGGFAAVSTYSAGTNSSPQDVAVGDLNGDGRLDIVTANANYRVGVLLGLAGGGFATVSTYSISVGSSPHNVAVADVNSDGRPDIVTLNPSSADNTVSVLLNTGTFVPLAAMPGTPPAEDVALFPNPARDGFTVQLPAAWGAAPVRAELRNALGQVVAVPTAALPNSGSTLPFATASLAPGVYVLRLQAGSHALTKRVVLD